MPPTGHTSRERNQATALQRWAGSDRLHAVRTATFLLVFAAMLALSLWHGSVELFGYVAATAVFCACVASREAGNPLPELEPVAGLVGVAALTGVLHQYGVSVWTASGLLPFVLAISGRARSRWSVSHAIPSRHQARQHTPPSRGMVVGVATLVIVKLADIGSTALLLWAGMGAEANPLVRYLFIEIGPALGLLLAGMIFVVGTTFVVESIATLLCRWFESQAWWGVPAVRIAGYGTASVITAVVVANNLLLALTQQTFVPPEVLF